MDDTPNDTSIVIPPIFSDEQLLGFKQARIDDLEQMVSDKDEQLNRTREVLHQLNITHEEVLGRLTATESARQRLAEDCATIAAELLSEAERREWCDEYDSFVHSLNTQLSQRWFKACPRESTHTFTVTVGVTAPSESYEDICEQLKEYLEGAAEGVSNSDAFDISVSVVPR